MYPSHVRYFEVYYKRNLLVRKISIYFKCKEKLNPTAHACYVSILRRTFVKLMCGSNVLLYGTLYSRIIWYRITISLYITFMSFVIIASIIMSLICRTNFIRFHTNVHFLSTLIIIHHFLFCSMP